VVRLAIRRAAFLSWIVKALLAERAGDEGLGVTRWHRGCVGGADF